MTRSFLPPSGKHDSTCMFLCKRPCSSCEHSCKVCDGKSPNDVLRELGYRTEPMVLRNGEANGRKNIYKGDVLVLDNAHASHVWHYLHMKHPETKERRHV